MFFLFGISEKEKDLDFNQTIICPTCESYGRLKAFMTYKYFSLFFIPLIKWDKKYYIRITCCNSLYSINSDLGLDLEWGDLKKIREKDLKAIKVNRSKGVRCSSCNYSLASDYEYCPKCGKKL